MSKDSKYSLRELAELTGIEPRTIRWYIAEGLLKGPESRGPKAYYTEQHRRRIETIRQLKETFGLPISEIRRYVTMAGDEDIQVVPVYLTRTGWQAGMAERMGTPASGQQEGENEYELFDVASQTNDEDTRSPGEMQPHDRRARWAAGRASLRPPSLHAALPPLESRLAGPQSPLVKLLELLRSIMGRRRIHRQARGSNWLEIEVTPDIVLRLRGDFDVQQTDLFEQLADHLRAYILGGGEISTPDDAPRNQEGGPG